MNKNITIDVSNWSSKIHRAKTSSCRLKVVNHPDDGVLYELDKNTSNALNAAIVGHYLSITPAKDCNNHYTITVHARYKGEVVASHAIDVNIVSGSKRHLALGLIVGLTVPALAASTAGALICSTFLKDNNNPVKYKGGDLPSKFSGYENEDLEFKASDFSGIFEGTTVTFTTIEGTSSDNNIAIVTPGNGGSSSIMINYVKAGNCTINLTLSDNNEHQSQATINIVVKPESEKIIIDNPISVTPDGSFDTTNKIWSVGFADIKGNNAILKFKLPTGQPIPESKTGTWTATIDGKEMSYWTGSEITSEPGTIYCDLRSTNLDGSVGLWIYGYYSGLLPTKMDTGKIVLTYTPRTGDPAKYTFNLKQTTTTSVVNFTGSTSLSPYTGNSMLIGVSTFTDDNGNAIKGSTDNEEWNETTYGALELIFNEKTTGLIPPTKVKPKVTWYSSQQTSKVTLPASSETGSTHWNNGNYDVTILWTVPNRAFATTQGQDAIVQINLTE